MNKNKKTRENVLSIYDEAIINIVMFEGKLNQILVDNHTDEKAVVSLYYAINNFKMKLEEILGKGTNHGKTKR